jgi:hypothetical protein
MIQSGVLSLRYEMQKGKCAAVDVLSLVMM